MHRRIDGQGGRRMLACAMALAGAALAPAAFAQQGAPAPGSIDTQYNACRGTNPNCYNDWGAFTNTPNKVLIYSRTPRPPPPTPPPPPPPPNPTTGGGPSTPPPKRVLIPPRAAGPPHANLGPALAAG